MCGQCQQRDKPAIILLNKPVPLPRPLLCLRGTLLSLNYFRKLTGFYRESWAVRTKANYGIICLGEGLFLDLLSTFSPG